MLLLGVGFASACKPPQSSGDRPPEVRARPVPEPDSEESQWLVPRIPQATWDRGLAQATSALSAVAIDPGSRLTPQATADALAAAGYPGNPRFVREYNGGAWPESMIEALASAAAAQGQPVDVALSRRVYGDGTALWIAAIAERPVTLDPLPRDIPLDDVISVRVDMQETAIGDELTLFVAPPDGTVQTHPLTDGVGLWLDQFHVPGEYRMEVVTSGDTNAQVVLLWSNFVEQPVPTLSTLPRASTDVPDPAAATINLYTALDTLRANAGLPRLERFDTFEVLARAHARRMASANVVAHVIDGVTPGVAAEARANFHPKALHRQDVAAASDWEEAMALLTLSPGHLQNLLCTSCTHVSIGTALEPYAIGEVPRLFVVWELLEFPNGVPKKIERFDR